MASAFLSRALPLPAVYHCFSPASMMCGTGTAVCACTVCPYTMLLFRGRTVEAKATASAAGEVSHFLHLRLRFLSSRLLQRLHRASKSRGQTARGGRPRRLVVLAWPGGLRSPSLPAPRNPQRPPFGGSRRSSHRVQHALRTAERVRRSRREQVSAPGRGAAATAERTAAYSLDSFRPRLQWMLCLLTTSFCY